MRKVVSAGLLAVLLCGCSTLPTDGEVRSRAENGTGSGSQAPYFAPPGPTRGDNREGVVRGFLLAMQANPPSTAVARSFLTERAAATWTPDEGTYIYDGSSVEVDGELIRASLSDAHQLDPRGRWDTGPGGPPPSIGFELVREDDEWRIDNPQNVLAVPASYFSSLFVPFHLYFFDRTGTVLVPERVYLPRGEQTASNLLRGLLAGPRSSEKAALTTAIPGGRADRGVLVSEDGVAEVPIGSGVLRLPGEQLDRVVAQLAWTLRQVPGITRMRLTVDGLGVPLPNGQDDVSVRTGAQFDPVAAPGRSTWGLVGRRVVRIEDDTAVAVGGPLGRPGFALRSVAGTGEFDQVAAVARNGRVLYVAPDGGPTAAARVRVAVNGTDLLRPVYDRFGSLWTVDRTAGGAVVHVVRGDVDRVVRVPGVTGRNVVAFTVTRDGARIAAALAGDDSPRVLVASLVRDAKGRFLSASPARTVDADVEGRGRIVDLGQSSETSLALLLQSGTGSGRILQVEIDGSPGEPSSGNPRLIPGTLRGLAVSPDPDLPTGVVTVDGQLLVQDGTGQWVPSPLDAVLAVAYPN